MAVHLRLSKGLSFSKGKLRATKRNPDVYVDEATAESAVASGYFIRVDDSAAPEPEAPGTGTKGPDYEELAKKTKAELTEYAETAGIDIGKCKTKEDILQAISAANGGSYTMMELQQE